MPLDAAELGAYRRRARRLLGLLDAALAATGDQWAERLGLLAARLAELVEDLESVGAAAAAVRPLAELRAELDRILERPPAPDRHPGQAEPGDRDAVAAWLDRDAVVAWLERHARPALAAFADDLPNAATPPGTTAPGGAFWARRDR
jgi:hypothetical protein